MFQGFQQRFGAGNRGKTDASAAHQRPGLCALGRRNLEQSFSQRLGNPPWDQPLGSDPHHRLVDGEAGDGNGLKACGNGAGTDHGDLNRIEQDLVKSLSRAPEPEPADEEVLDLIPTDQNIFGLQDISAEEEAAGLPVENEELSPEDMEAAIEAELGGRRR